MKNRVKSFSFQDVKQYGTIFLAPYCNASRKLKYLLEDQGVFEDTDFGGFLDTYKEEPSLNIKKIESFDGKSSECVIVAIEREEYRADILSALKHKRVALFDLKDNIKNTTTTKSDEYFYFVYDLRVLPSNFEFLSALGIAEHKRKKAALKKLACIFVMPEEGSIYDLSRSSLSEQSSKEEKSNHWFLTNVLIDSLSLLPSCDGGALSLNSEAALELLKNIPTENKYISSKNLLNPFFENFGPYFWQLARDFPEDAHPFEASETAKIFVSQWIKVNGLDGQKFIVINFRESKNYQARNTNLKTWLEVADLLEALGYKVVIVRDTYAAFDYKQEFLGRLIFNEAAWNLQLRTAIYELAFCVVGGNNGPLQLAIQNRKVSYIHFFKFIEEGTVFETSREYFSSQGIEVGESYAAALDDQHFVWGDTDNASFVFNSIQKNLPKE